MIWPTVSRVSFACEFDSRDGRITNMATAFGAVTGTLLRYKELEAMLLGKTVVEARFLKPDYLRSYADRLVHTQGLVSEEYRRDVCMNLLDTFLTKFGI